jgi:acetoin utilization deacetylase AcuC-like enzyme
MGFCLLNNIALSAEFILGENAKRLAIVDVDLHHGNGTQDIFWLRKDVLYISTHQSPLYPGTGMLTDIGAGEGRGQSPRGIERQAIFQALREHHFNRTETARALGISRRALFQVENGTLSHGFMININPR